MLIVDVTDGIHSRIVFLMAIGIETQITILCGVPTLSEAVSTQSVSESV